MIGKANDLPRALPLIASPGPDELLSSWLTRIAQDYYIPPRGLLTHMGLSSPSVERLDLTLTFAQAIAISGFVRQPPDAIIGMTHARLPVDCQSLVWVKYPQQSCRSCASQLKRNGATGAVLKSWMQGWRVTCRACGGAMPRTRSAPPHHAQQGVIAYVNAEPARKGRRRPASERNSETVHDIVETACSPCSWLDRLEPFGEYPPGAGSRRRRRSGAPALSARSGRPPLADPSAVFDIGCERDDQRRRTPDIGHRPRSPLQRRRSHCRPSRRSQQQTRPERALKRQTRAWH